MRTKMKLKNRNNRNNKILRIKVLIIKMSLKIY